MFRFTGNNEGILKLVCFVIDFAPKKGKEDATLFEAHRLFACGCAVLDVLSGLKKRSKGRAVRWRFFYQGSAASLCFR
jgi:hypothetical protein